VTAQEVINTVAQHLLTQGKKASDHGGSCRYRTTQGLSCAVGCLLTDDEYSPKMEGRMVGDISRSLPTRLRQHHALLVRCQAIHDELAVNEWPGAIRKLAEKLGLEVPEGCRES